jgi:transcriptional regulator GlxA family with amidase domain
VLLIARDGSENLEYIVPCMGSTLAMPEVIEIVSAAATKQVPIAAGDGAIMLLARGGLLKGKRFAVQSTFAGAIQDGTQAGTGVVQDGLIITAGTCPIDRFDKTREDATRELTLKFIRAVKKSLANKTQIFGGVS